MTAGRRNRAEQILPATAADATAAHLAKGSVDRQTGWTNAVGLLVVLCVEVLMFYFQVSHQIAPYYPRNFDQTEYFLQTYDLLEKFKAEGWRAFATQLLHPAAATGATFTLQGALLALIGGANRTAMLSLNLLYFLALQLVLFDTVRHRTRNAHLAWIAMALLLSTFSVFGIFDYRIDFSALCLYGMWACLIVRSHGLLDPNSELAVAMIGILLVSERFFTILYIGTVLMVLFVATLAVTSIRSPGATFAAQRSKRVFVAGAVTGLVTFPLLFAARHAIYDYYIQNHVIGDEKFIRAAEVGVHSFVDHVLYYPRSVLDAHLGHPALWLVAALVAASAALAVLSRPSRLSVATRLTAYGFELLALALATLAPLTLLTIDISKSPVVGGIVVVPVILMVVLLCSVFWPSNEPAPGRPLSAQGRPDAVAGSIHSRQMSLVRGMSTLVSVSFVVLALAGFLWRGTANRHGLSRLDLGHITRLNDAVARYALESHGPSPSISFDRVADYLNLGTVRLFGYEHYGRLLDLRPRFGNRIFATPRGEALRLIADSDVVILTDPLRGRTQPYPLNAEIPEYWEEIRESAGVGRALLLSTSVADVPYKIFARPFVH